MLKSKLLFNNKGQALVEAAITIPLLIFMTCVIIQLALLYNAKLVVNYAAFCAARTGLVYGKDETAKINQAARIACTPICYPVSQEIKAAQTILGNIGVNITLPTDNIFNFLEKSGFGAVTDILERYVTSCLRTKVTYAEAGNNTFTAEVTHKARMIFPMGALGRLVAGSRYKIPIEAIQNQIPDELEGAINKLESIQDNINEFSVPIRSRCTLNM
jgi:Flp pilus assembly protein TadG